MDIGAGTGFSSIPLAKKDHVVVGIDNCEKMVNILRSKVDHMDIDKFIFPVKADILDTKIQEKLPNEHKVFDGAIFWGNGLCHINPEDYKLLVKNIKKLLKPKGWLLLDYRSGESMRSRGSHIEILFNSSNEIRLSCVHAIPREGYGPIHRALVSLNVSTVNDICNEPKITKASFNSIWPYLVDDRKLENILTSEEFLRGETLNTRAPLSDMVTFVYWLK